MNCIAGIFALDGHPVPADVAQRLLSALPAERGCKRQLWQGGRIALMEVRSGVTPEEEALQTATMQGGALFEGRLDNRDSLRRDLRVAGVQMPNSVSDAHLLRLMFDTSGAGLPGRLLGDFAYALWDQQRQSLILGVDPIGACPIFHARTERYFAFATHEETLLALPGLSAEPNEAKVANFLFPQFRGARGSDGWFADISVLPAGHTLTIGPSGVPRLAEYWQWQNLPEHRYASEREALEAFRETFGEAVRCRIDSGGSPAQLLSGGLDSAGIFTSAASLLARSGSTLQTYSAIADDPQSDIESRSIEAMAGAKAVRIHLPSFSGPIGWSKVLGEAWESAHPSDNALLLSSLLCGAARHDGHRSMLHGVSGDVTQHLPARYIAFLQRGGQWREAWKECVGASRNSTMFEGVLPLRLFLQNLWTAEVPAQLNRLVHRAQLPSIAHRVAGGNLHPDLAFRLGVAERLKQDQAHQRRPLPTTLQQEFIGAVAGPFGLEVGLRGFARLGKRYGMQMRDPWADRRVVSFFLALPLRYKVNDGWTKQLLRKSLDGALPPSVVWRRDKQHLGWLISRRLLGPDGGDLIALLDRAAPHAAPYVRPEAVAAARDYLSDRVAGRDYSFAQHKLAYDLLVLGLWLRRMSNVVRAFEV